MTSTENSVSQQSEIACACACVTLTVVSEPAADISRDNYNLS